MTFNAAAARALMAVSKPTTEEITKITEIVEDVMKIVVMRIQMRAAAGDNVARLSDSVIPDASDWLGDDPSPIADEVVRRLEALGFEVGHVNSNDKSGLPRRDGRRPCQDILEVRW